MKNLKTLQSTTRRRSRLDTNAAPLYVLRNKTNEVVTVKASVRDSDGLSTDDLIAYGGAPFTRNLHPADAERENFGDSLPPIKLAPRKNYQYVGNIPVPTSQLVGPSMSFTGELPALSRGNLVADNDDWALFRSYPSMQTLIFQWGYSCQLPFYSFVIIHDETPYVITLDFGKHITMLTAELNVQLHRISAEVCGYFECDLVDQLLHPGRCYNNFKLWIDPGSLSLTFLNPKFYRDGESPDSFKARRGNPEVIDRQDEARILLPSTHIGFGIEDKPYYAGNEPTMDSRTTSFILDANGRTEFGPLNAPVNFLDPSDVVKSLSDKFQDIITVEVEDPDEAFIVTIPSDKFSVDENDHRYNYALLRFIIPYDKGDTWFLTGYYLDDDDNPDYSALQDEGIYAFANFGEPINIDSVPAEYSGFKGLVSHKPFLCRERSLNDPEGRLLAADHDGLLELGVYNQESENMDRADTLAVFPRPINNRHVPYFRRRNDTKIRFKLVRAPQSTLHGVPMASLDDAPYYIRPEDRPPVVINPYLPSSNEDRVDWAMYLRQSDEVYTIQDTWGDVSPLGMGGGNLPEALNGFITEPGNTWDWNAEIQGYPVRIANFRTEPMTLYNAIKQIMPNATGLVEVPWHCIVDQQVEGRSFRNFKKVDSLPLRVQLPESYLSQINLRTNLDDYSLSDGPPQLAGNYRVDIYFRHGETWDSEPTMIDIPRFFGWDVWYVADGYSDDIVEYDPDDASKRPWFFKYFLNSDAWVTRYVPLTPTLILNGVEIYAIPALQQITGNTFTKTIRVILRNTNPEEVQLKVEVKHELEPGQWETLQTRLVYEAQSNWLLAARDPDTIVSRLTLGANITDFGTTHRYERNEPNQNVQWNLLEEQDPWPLNERSYYLRAEINGVEKLVFLNSEEAGYNRLYLLNRLFYSLLMNDDENDRSRSFQFNYDEMDGELSYVEIGAVQTPNKIGKENSLQEANWAERLYESNKPATLKILPYIDPDNGNGPRVVEDAYFWLFGNGESPVIQAPVKLIPVRVRISPPPILVAM